MNLPKTGSILRRLLIIIPVAAGVILVTLFMPAQHLTIEGIGILSFETTIDISVGYEVAYAHPAVPVVETWEENFSATASTSLTCNKPSGVQAGDLLVLIPMNEAGTSTIQFSNNKTGWNFLGTSGNTTSDAHIGFFWRIADGTEGTSETVVAAGSYRWGMYYLRISGFDSTTPINASNFAASTSSASVHNIPAITTSVDDCLILYGLSFDGGDGLPFSVGSPWIEKDEYQTGTSGFSASSGCYGYRELADLGSSEICAVTCNASDGAAYFQVAIAPPSDLVGTPVVDDFIPFEYEQTADLTPAFRFSAIDPDGTDDLHYQIQIDDDHAFGSILHDDNSSDDPSYFENIDTPADDPPFNEGETIEYVPPSSLADDTAYYWRVRCKEADTSYGDWMVISSGYYYSVSTDDSLSDSRWFQTEDEQFETGAQNSVTISGGSVSLTTGGAISRLDASASGTSSTLNYSVSSGSNRVLIVHIGWESTANDTAVSGVTYGGQSMTEAFQIATPDSGYQAGVASYYILDAGIEVASGNTISPSFSGTAYDDIMITAASYEGVNQTGGSTTVPETHTAETNEATPNPFTTIDITETSGNLVVAAIACGNATSFTWQSDMTEQEDVLAASSATGFADRLAVTESNVTIEATVASQNRAAAGSAEFAAASTSSGSLVSRIIDYDWLSGASDWGQLIFTDNESAGDIKYDIEYWDGDSWEDTSIVNQDSSPVDISALDGTTHNQIRIEATLTDVSGTPYLNDWAISWTTGVVDISNAPSSKDFGFVAENSSYWSNTTAPTWPLDDGECYFTVTNNGSGSINISIRATNFTGGVGWTLVTGVPGLNQTRLTAWESGDGEGDGINLTTSDLGFISSLAGSSSKKWELRLTTGTFSDGVGKSSTITLTATSA